MNNLREVIARAISFRLDNREPLVDHYAATDLALSSIKEAGYMVVPVEATEAMLSAASCQAQKPAGWNAVYRNIWKAMLNSTNQESEDA